MTKPIWNIRPESFLVEEVEKYAAIHKMKDTEGNFNRTDALHGLFKELVKDSSQTRMAMDDAATWQTYALDLAKNQPVFCKSMNADISKQRCYNCAVTSQRMACPIGLDIRVNHLSLEAAHNKHAGPGPKVASVTSPGVPCSQTGSGETQLEESTPIGATL